MTFDGELEESPPLQLIHLSLSEYKPHSSVMVNPSGTMEKTQKDSENRKIKIFSADYKFPEFQVWQSDLVVKITEICVFIDWPLKEMTS